MRTVLKYIPLLAFLLISGISFGQTNHDFLSLIVDTTNDKYGYVNSKGDTVIQLDKYSVCWTEKFYKFAIVSTRNQGIVGIDRKENILFTVYIFDNGPDYISNGLFRITRDGKIGYADNRGHIIIQPQFDCAFPFENGKAKVGKGCKTQTDGEHGWWTDGKWFTIDKKGNISK